MRDRGYLRADLQEIADRLGTEREDVEAVLGVLQGFDPVGVGARDLAECLSLQLKAKDRLDPAMAAFSLETLPLNDKASYELLTQAKTVAVFQLESRGMQGMLKDARPDRFEDIIALVAL